MSAIDNLTSGAKRVRIHNAQMVTKLPQAVKDLVNDIATSREITEAAIVREALSEYLTKRGYRA